MKEPTNRPGEVGLPRDALRNVASADAVERVWQRLDTELAPGRPLARRPSLSWAVAASVATFALGIAVGHEGTIVGPSTELATRAEPQLQQVAGAQARTGGLAQEEQTGRLGNGQQDSSERRAPRGVEREHNGGWAARAKELLTELPAEAAPVANPLDVPIVPEVVPSEQTVAHPPSWQRLANSGEYEAALFELGQDGGFEAALLASNAEQLMLLADVARATGQTQRALAALRRVVSEFRGEPVAPLAAYSLGKLLEKSGDARGAAQAFAVYRALQPEGDFAEDALVRQLRSAVERDDRDYAKQLAAQYQVDFPEGRRGEEVSHWLDELAAKELALGADAGSGEANPSPGNGTAEENEAKGEGAEPAPPTDTPPPPPEE